MENIIYTVNEISELLHINRNSVYDLCKSGVLPFLKLGSIKIRRQALIDFLEKYEGYDLTNPYEVVKIKNTQSLQQ